jgi:hypothetical protein
MSSSLKSEVRQPKPNAPHMLRDASPAAGGAWPQGQGRILIRIPDLSDSTNDPTGSRKVQRLIDVLKLLRNRPRSLAAGGIVLAGALLVTAVLTVRQPPAAEKLTTAPEFDPIVHARRRMESPYAAMPRAAEATATPAPQILAEVPAATDRGPSLLGPTLRTRALGSDQFAMPGVARLLGEIVPDTLEEAKHESSRPGLH